MGYRKSSSYVESRISRATALEYRSVLDDLSPILEEIIGLSVYLSRENRWFGRRHPINHEAQRLVGRMTRMLNLYRTDLGELMAAYRQSLADYEHNFGPIPSDTTPKAGDYILKPLRLRQSVSDDDKELENLYG